MLHAMCSHFLLQLVAHEQMMMAVQGLVPALLGTVGDKLAAQDQDQEVKEAAIVCTGTCVASLGDLHRPTTSSLVQVALTHLPFQVLHMHAHKRACVLLEVRSLHLRRTSH